MGNCLLIPSRSSPFDPISRCYLCRALLLVFCRLSVGIYPQSNGLSLDLLRIFCVLCYTFTGDEFARLYILAICRFGYVCHFLFPSSHCRP